MLNRGFINLHMNSEEIGIELVIEGKEEILKTVGSQLVRNLSGLGFDDAEFAVWDGQSKVLKLYPQYMDDLAMNFLLTRLKALKSPVFKFRKRYPRDKEILRNRGLVDDLVNSIELIMQSALT
jgi:hypothetical protein